MAKTFYLGIFLFCGLISSVANADEIRIAVAANFARPMEKIVAAFEKETGHKIISSSGATGKFYAQIKEGAPFDILLSADQDHPKKLSNENFAVAETQFTYAIGKLALWSPKDKYIDSKGAILKKNLFTHISIANPKLAPYGVAAQATLEKMGLWHNLESKIVFGESISQAYQFVATGNAELGFVAFSQIKDSNGIKGSYWLVPQDFYSPLKQDAILLKNAKNTTAAKRFLEFLKGKTAKSIIGEFGYDG